MSVGKVRENIAQALAGDSKITAQDAARILSDEDHPLAAPESVGTFVDNDEYHTIKSLYEDVKSGRIQAEAGVEAMLRGFVEAGPDSRAGKIAERTAGWAAGGAFVGGIWNGGLGAAPGAGIGAAFGALYGAIMGIADD